MQQPTLDGWKHTSTNYPSHSSSPKDEQFSAGCMVEWIWCLLFDRRKKVRQDTTARVRIHQFQIPITADYFLLFLRTTA